MDAGARGSLPESLIAPQAEAVAAVGLGVPGDTLAAIVLANSPIIRIPAIIRWANAALWVLDAAADPWLHIVDARTGSLLDSFGRRGEQPGDFAALGGLGVVPSRGDIVWAHDSRLQRVTLFDARLNPGRILTTISLQGDPAVDRVVWIDSSTAVGVSASDTARFSLFSINGTRVKVVPGPLLGDANIALIERLRASHGLIFLCNRPGRSAFQITYSGAAQIDYYDSAAQLIGHAAVPATGEPVFVDDPVSRMPTYRQPRSYYLDCSATADYLYVLFSGRSTQQYPSDEQQNSGDVVHVFDWDGEFRRAMYLDRAVRSIAVDPTGTALFAASLIDGRVYRFPLPSMEAER